MQLRTALILSVGINLVLGAGWYYASRPQASVVVSLLPPDNGGPTKGPSNAVPRPRVNVVTRTQLISWKALESSDYMVYIRNLRAVECPEQTIRDIIIADVNQAFSRRRATEAISVYQHWWRLIPDGDLEKDAAAKLLALESERKSLLTKLLGPGWESDPNVPPLEQGSSICLTGPILGDLPDATKLEVYNIAVGMDKKLDAYREAQLKLGKPTDPAEELRIQQGTRSELAKLLTPAQLEEFLLRYSDTAQFLRMEMHSVELSADEFRALFKAQDAIQSQTAWSYDGADPEAKRMKDALQQESENSIRTALGDERYKQYKLNQDPEYVEAKVTFSKLGLGDEKLMPVYQINQLTGVEIQRIRSDDSLSLDEKVEAIANVQLEQQRSLQQVLGEKAFAKWIGIKAAEFSK